MTDFGESIKEMIKTEQTAVEVIEKKKRTTQRPEPYFVYEVDPTSKLDVVIKRWNGAVDEKRNKVTHELYILFSIGKIWMKKDGIKVTDDFILKQDGLKEFFRGVLKKDQMYTIPGCKGTNGIVNSAEYIWIMKQMMLIPNISACIKDSGGEIKLEMIADNFYDSYYEGYRYARGYRLDERYPWFFEKKLAQTPKTMEEFFSHYTRNTAKKKRIEALAREGIKLDTLNDNEKGALEAMEYYFDLPFACKVIKEYKDDPTLDGLNGNAVYELLGLSKDRNDFYARDGVMRYRYTEGNVRTYTKESRVKFEDKNAWWRYVLRGAEEECLKKDLGKFMQRWKNVLAAQIYMYGHVTNRYPSRYKYVKDETGEVVRIPSTSPSLSFMLATMPLKASQMEEEAQNGKLAEILGELADALECNKIVNGTKYILKCMRTDEDFVNEASNQQNCVNSIYKDKVLRGERTSIFSIRYANEPDKSFITVEIDPLDGHIPQALKKNNAHLNSAEKEIVKVFENECMKRVRKMRNKNSKSDLDGKMKAVMEENEEDEE